MINTTKYTEGSQKNFILIISLLFLVLTIFLIKDIFGVIIYSFILSYFLFPLYKFFLNKFENKRLASLLTLITATIGIFIPLALISYFLILNLIKIVAEYKVYIENPEIFNQVISDFIQKATNNNFITSIDFSEFFSTFIIAILEYAKDFFASIPNFMLSLFILLFISYYVLIYNKAILKGLNEYIPLGLRKQNEIIKNITKNINVLFKGYFLTGLIQTLFAFAAYALIGVPNILIITFLTLITSLMPYIGTPLVWVPLSFYLIITGNEIGGIGLLIYGTLVISMIDNFIRPVLMSNKDTIPAPLVFVGFIGGLIAFGLEGIILGPIIISITAILLRYLKEIYEVKETE